MREFHKDYELVQQKRTLVQQILWRVSKPVFKIRGDNEKM